MGNRYAQFAATAVQDLLRDEHGLLAFPGSAAKLQVRKPNETLATLDLTPFAATPAPSSALSFFDGAYTVEDLLAAYAEARHSLPFEEDDAQAMERVAPYARQFIESVLSRAKARLSNDQAQLVAQWVKHLDVYCAVRSVESLLYSRADLALLEAGRELGWSVHFDHLAIRCGTRAHLDAERVEELLTEQHGYVASQVPEESFYQFPDGWNAYPVYKLLNNGQMLRVFIDQSDAEDRVQIIQHWNRVYGYTAHHLAMRATRLEGNQRVAVPLSEVMAVLAQRGVSIMTPTGEYTQGLLLQVFTRPEKDSAIPLTLKAELAKTDVTLPQVIENAKLLELVSRLEMKTPLARQLFGLYGLDFDPANPLHSAPLYQYFLPEQAAHVIKTSQQVS